jgi:hypothetical protein
MLFTLTLIVSFLTMALSLWLGLYVVARSPRSLIAWLTGFTLWTIARLFMGVLLALNPPPMPINEVGLLRLFFPFWRAVTLKEQGATGWLQGWSVITAVMLWHHVTTLMRPGPLTSWRWTRILTGYGVAVAWNILNIATPFFFASTTGDPLYLNTLKAGPVYPIFAVFLLLYTGMSITNLVRSAYVAPAVVLRKQFMILAIATVIGGLTGPLSIAASAFGLPVPLVTLALLFGIYVVLIGYGVARYSALIDGRTIWHDFIYNAVTVGLVTFLYLLVTWISVQAYNIPAVAFVFVVMLAIVTHSLLDIARHGLDSLFYRRDTRRLRDNLRQLTTLAGEQADQEEYLSLALDSLCASVQATFGVLVLFEDNGLRLVATYRWPHSELPFSPADLATDDVLPLEPDHFPFPLANAALLIPLYADTKQLGSLILGQPKNGTSYSQTDLELLLYPSDWLADTIQNAQREAEHLARIASLAERGQPKVSQYPVQISVKTVENALRNLANYAYLGELSLVKMKLVKSRLPAGTVTHLDRGKAVYSVLAEAVEKLRPDGQLPDDPPPREWYSYLILYEAYFKDTLNRDIMARLYISEGTFNRIRRAALRAVTRTLEEMEATLK